MLALCLSWRQLENTRYFACATLLSSVCVADVRISVQKALRARPECCSVGCTRGRGEDGGGWDFFLLSSLMSKEWQLENASVYAGSVIGVRWARCTQPICQLVFLNTTHSQIELFHPKLQGKYLVNKRKNVDHINWIRFFLVYSITVKKKWPFFPFFFRACSRVHSWKNEIFWKACI